MWDQTLGFTAFQFYDECYLSGDRRYLGESRDKEWSRAFGELLRGVSIISTSARTAPSVYPDLGDCGEGGQDEMLLVCVVLSCVCVCFAEEA